MTRLTVSPLREAQPYCDLVEQYGSPFMLLDGDCLRQQYRRLCAALPDVALYYAIKSLPQLDVLRILQQEGASFDVASSGEIALLQKIRANPRHTIHTHPIKRDQDIRDALRFGCTTFVVDNVDELLKFQRYRSRVGLLLRVSFRSPSAVVDLSKKFGCALDDAMPLLNTAVQLGIHIKGLSFHVGSQCKDASAHVNAIAACHDLIQQARAAGFAPMSVLDIGGGFPADYQRQGIDIDRFCQPIRDALQLLPSHISVIAEPGRYLSAPAMKSISTVMGRAQRDGHRWYYLDDGLYGAYSGQLFDHMTYPLEVFSNIPERESSVLAGPTCDSIDVIDESIQLPPLRLGDIVVGHMMGAYTWATATEFNAFPKARVITIDTGYKEQNNRLSA